MDITRGVSGASSFVRFSDIPRENSAGEARENTLFALPEGVDLEL